jgi:hypothetical protein
MGQIYAWTTGARRNNKYLDVGREERELQRPSVLHAAGDHAGEDEPPEADRHGGLHHLGGVPASAAADARRELQLAVAARRHGSTALKGPYRSAGDHRTEDMMMMIRPRKAGGQGFARGRLESRKEEETRMRRCVLGGSEVARDLKDGPGRARLARWRWSHPTSLRTGFGLARMRPLVRPR